MNPIMKGLQALISPAKELISEFIVDKDKRVEAEARLTALILEAGSRELEAASNIIIAEAKGGSWLQRMWRPMTMMIFVGLVAAHWLGFTPPNLPHQQVMALLDIIKIGLGGYVLGRSAEKAVKFYRNGGK